MRWLTFPFRLLNSTIFGIVVMVAIGVYMAVGSGFDSVRQSMEMSELQFFQWWPLKVLIALLVVNLTVVTFLQIPFTPARYGVWAVHMGMIVLVFGMGHYYRGKVDGVIRVLVGETVNGFYDLDQRSLYMKVDGRVVGGWPLPDLPRFHEYTPRMGNVGRLQHPPIPLEFASEQAASVSVIGFWPAANIQPEYEDDPAVYNPGVKLTFAHPGGKEQLVGVAASGVLSDAMWGRASEVEHRHLSSTQALANALAAATQPAQARHWDLVPRQGVERHILFTGPEADQLSEVIVGETRSNVRALPNGEGTVQIKADDGNVLHLTARRSDHIRCTDEAVEIPVEQRNSGIRGGAAQVVRVRVTRGDWSGEALVPFAEFPPTEQAAQWSSPLLVPQAGGSELGGGNPRAHSVSFQLGYRWREDLPVSVCLKDFELVGYGPNTDVQRDFRSTLQVGGDGWDETVTVSLNHPFRFKDREGRNWIVSQSFWDSDGVEQLGRARWTGLGVGTREGLGVSVVGCGMMVAGLLWAFYVKPVLLRRSMRRTSPDAAAPASSTTRA